MNKPVKKLMKSRMMKETSSHKHVFVIRRIGFASQLLLCFSMPIHHSLHSPPASRKKCSPFPYFLIYFLLSFLCLCALILMSFFLFLLSSLGIFRQSPQPRLVRRVEVRYASLNFDSWTLPYTSIRLSEISSIYSTFCNTFLSIKFIYYLFLSIFFISVMFSSFLCT